MRVTAVETFLSFVGWRNWLLVKVSTDEGIVGWGEATTAGRERTVAAAIEHLSEYLIGRDPTGTAPNALILGTFVSEAELRDRVCTRPLQVETGSFALPTEPGLGTDILIEELADHPFKQPPLESYFQFRQFSSPRPSTMTPR